MSSPFQFKQFSVKQDRSAMKVGTDGVLLGSWVQPNNEPFNILDIGAGTGVISLMLAQRFSKSNIEAIEIDRDSYEEAVENFENSIWADRLFCYHASFQEYFQEVDDQEYDLIISNPPYFSATQKSANESRNKARFEDALPFEHLFYGASKLLSNNGIFCLVIPYDKEDKAIEIAKQMYLMPQRITHVKGTKEAKIKRSLMVFGFEKVEIIYSELIIEISRHNYTADYVDLVKEFYLKL